MLIWILIKRNLGASLVSQMVKNLPAKQETQETQLLSRSWEDPLEEGIVTQYSCLENPTDRSLAGYSPWGHEELDMTEVT